MDIRNRRGLRQAAGQALAKAPGSPKQVALVYAAVVTALALGDTLAFYVLNRQIAETGGLSNIGLRSLLSTVRSLLPLVPLVVQLLLELGHHAAALEILRGRPTGPWTLLEGFRRFGPLLRAVLLMGLRYGIIAIGALYLSTYVFLLLPVSGDFYAVLEPLLDSSDILQALEESEAAMAAATQAMLPMLVIYGVLLLLFWAPVYYNYRMVNFCLADAERPRARAALRQSKAMMRRNRFALFRLDLSLWWYYLLQVLILGVAYLDVLLPLVGVTLPWSETVSYYLFYVLSLGLQFMLYCFAMNRVRTVYAQAYEALKPTPEPPSGGVVLGNIFDLYRQQ